MGSTEDQLVRQEALLHTLAARASLCAAWIKRATNQLQTDFDESSPNIWMHWRSFCCMARIRTHEVDQTERALLPTLHVREAMSNRRFG